MIFPDEVRLTSRRYPMDGTMALDDTGQRIERLMQHYLVKLDAGPKGRGVLFRDPKDGRFWELLCPDAEPHGFTLPELVCVSPAEAERKYGRALVAN